MSRGKLAEHQQEGKKSRSHRVNMGRHLLECIRKGKTLSRKEMALKIQKDTN